MFFKKRFIKKYKEKLLKIRKRNRKKLLKQKFEFSKILNHDIKTVLLAQKNCLELLLKERFNKINLKQKKMLSEILFSNKFLIEIINNAIFLAEIDEKISDIKFEKVDIINQAQNCLDEIKYMAKNKEQKIILDIKNKDINLNCDKKLIQKIITNILTSSVSYGFENSDIIVSIEENNNEITFKTKNKSIYMTKEKINSIFQNTESKNDFNQLGMKLNLNIAKKLVGVHNWDFIATSDEKDKSSTFGFVVKKHSFI